MTTILSCPHCNEMFKGGDVKPGEKIYCLSCGQAFYVPEVPTPAPEQTPPPPPPVPPVNSSQPAPVKKPESTVIQVVVKKLDLSFGDIFALTFKVMVSMILIGLAIGAFWWIVILSFIGKLLFGHGIGNP